jgi:integrase/recombinase XerD
VTSQLRHVHASELVNVGVSLETIRPRLGHANAQTVQRYTERKDTTVDTEIRSWGATKIRVKPAMG